MDANDKSATTSRKALTTVAILPLGQVDEAELEFVADVLRNFLFPNQTFACGANPQQLPPFKTRAL